MTILHKAEEHGQARELKASEVLAFGLVSGIKATACGMGAIAVVTGGRLLMGENVSLASIALTGSGVFAVSVAVHLLGDLDTLIDGLRSFRSVETFAPPEVKPEPQPVATPSSPVIVKPYGADPYILDRNETPQLPDGRQVQLGLNPPTLAAILEEVIKQHGGQWSRRRLMSLRVHGERVTRSLYEDMTDALARAGFLQPQPQGGFALPPDVSTFEDVRRYLDLPSGADGGTAGRQECPVGSDGDPVGGAGGSLAERRRQRFIECDCNVASYLEWRNGS
jgi:hypothetical protein